MIVNENEVITSEIATKIEALGLDAVRVRSPLTCDSHYGICAKCYGWDLSTGKLVECATQPINSLVIGGCSLHIAPVNRINQLFRGFNHVS